MLPGICPPIGLDGTTAGPAAMLPKKLELAAERLTNKPAGGRKSQKLNKKVNPWQEETHPSVTQSQTGR